MAIPPLWRISPLRRRVRAVLNHGELCKALDAWGARDVDDRPDRVNSISSKVIRCEFKGQRAVAVSGETDTKTQIGAVLDLLDLHYAGDGTYRGQPVADDEVTLFLT